MQNIKKASYADLAKYLGVTVSTVSKYPKKKRLLMLVGLSVIQPKLKAKSTLIIIDDFENPA